MKRTQPPPTKKKGSWSCSDAGFQKRYPAITAFLADAWWDDGEPRELGSLTVRMGGEKVQVSLTDYDQRATSFTDAETLDEALALAEEALSAGKMRFTPWKSSAGKKK